MVKKTYKARKRFIVVAYDVSNTIKRNKIAKMLENYGERINLSVFECMLNKKDFENLKVKIEMILNKSSDKVIYYTLCLDCFTKIVYVPHEKRNPPQTITA